MRRALFTFARPNPDGVVATSRITKFLENELDLEAIWSDYIAIGEYDVLYVVGGAFAFCKSLPAIGAAVAKARRVIWIQNDYTIVPPSPVSLAESPFRKGFRQRREAGLPDTDMWTTIKKNASNTPLSRYINWNQLTHEPCEVQRKKKEALVYYGAFREGRVKGFDRYFNMDIPVVVSSPSSKFRERYENVYLTGAVPRSEFLGWLGSFAAGLYLEDNKSHREFHSPANRFYEMLGARTAMIFEPEAVVQLKAAGLDVSPWVAEGAEAVRKLIAGHKKVLRAQMEAFDAPYVAQLRKQVKAARKAVEHG